MVIKYLYQTPWHKPDGTPVYEEYELYSVAGDFLSIHYTNPDVTLPMRTVHK